MSRQKRPHRFDVIELPCDPSVPLELQRALYTRLSDDDLEKVSHTSQQDEIQRAFGLTQELPLPDEPTAAAGVKLGRSGRDRGYVVTVIIRDWRTGVDPNRLGFRELLAGARAGKHGGVLFRDDDRLYRGVKGGWPLIELHEELPNYTFEDAVDEFNIDDFAIHAHQSDKERKKTRKRTMAARAMRARAGQAVHTKFPYWLARDPKTGGAMLVEDRADAMREAIRLYADGTRTGLVTQWLREHAPQGGESLTWSSDRFREALRNPALYGRLDYGRHIEVRDKRGDDFVVTGRKVNPHAIRFDVPPLIHKSELERVACQMDGTCPMDTLPSFERLEEMIQASNLRTGGRPATRPYPLRRRVVCACGWRMAYAPKWLDGGREQDYGYLTCCRDKQRGTSVVRDYPPCSTGTIVTRTFWPVVRDLFIDAVRNPDAVIAQVEADILAAAASEARTAAEDAATVERITEALAELAAAENRLYERYDRGEISKQVYDGQSARIATQRRTDEEVMRQVLDRRRILQTASTATTKLRQELAKAGELPFDRLDFAEWTELFEGLVQDVLVDEQRAPHFRWHQS